MEKEIWRPITGYEGLYEVSNYGRIFSHKRHRLLKPCRNTKGYLHFDAFKDGKRKAIKIHRAVYESFVGEIPKGYDINHIDENKENNCVWNLNLMTKAENNRYGHHYENVSSTLKRKMLNKRAA